VTGTQRHIASYSTKNVASDEDGRLYSPSFERNFEPIREAFSSILRKGDVVLEIGSGTGQHITHLAAKFPDQHWIGSDYQDRHLASIRAWIAHLALPNLGQPLTLDATGPWSEKPELATPDRPSVIFCANVIHIAPWQVAEGIIGEAVRILKSGGRLIFYGPFRESGRDTGAGNAAFDRALRAENPAWGVRDLGDLTALAAAAGFGPPEIRPMPSNNRFVVFRLG